LQNNIIKQMSVYDLEERTLKFAKDTIFLCKKLPKDGINSPMISQLIRSATSVGANYREANDGLGKKDFILRLKIARKEAKETSYWLELLSSNNPVYFSDFQSLINECIELRNIFSSMIAKLK
jgi:four helix bundle protein